MDRAHAGQLLPVARNDTATLGLAGVHASASFELPHGSTPFMPNICALFSANENDGHLRPRYHLLFFLVLAMTQNIELAIETISLILMRDHHNYPSLELNPQNAANDDLENEGEKS